MVTAWAGSSSATDEATAPKTPALCTERLRRELPDHNVFIDLEGIAPGQDFATVIEGHLGGCDAVVVLIGKEWLGFDDALGTSRISNPADFVHMEVATALRSGIQVFPVLLDGARMPASDELPADLKPLVRKQTIGLDFTRFDADAGTLAREISRALHRRDSTASESSVISAPGTSEAFQTRAPSRPRLLSGRVAIAVGLLAMAIVAGILYFKPSASGDQNPQRPEITRGVLRMAALGDGTIAALHTETGRLATISADGSSRQVWQSSCGGRAVEVMSFGGAIGVACLSEQGQPELFQVETGGSARRVTIPGPAAKVAIVAASPQGEVIYFTTADGEALRYDVSSQADSAGSGVIQLALKSSYFADTSSGVIAVGALGELATVNADTGYVTVHSGEGKVQWRGRVFYHGDPRISYMTFSPPSNWLVVVSADSITALEVVANNVGQGTVETPSGFGISAIAYEPKTYAYWVGSRDGVALVRYDNGKGRREFFRLPWTP